MTSQTSTPAATGTSATDEPRILLIANRTCPCPDVLMAVRDRAGERGTVHVVAPALNGRVRHYVSDIDGAVAAAQERLDVAVRLLREHGVDATGELGDSDPLTAATDAVHAFAATEIVVSTYPKGKSNWLERDLPARLADRFDQPVTHLVSRFGLADVPPADDMGDHAPAKERSIS